MNINGREIDYYNTYIQNRQIRCNVTLLFNNALLGRLKTLEGEIQSSLPQFCQQMRHFHKQCLYTRHAVGLGRIRNGELCGDSGICIFIPDKKLGEHSFDCSNAIFNREMHVASVTGNISYDKSKQRIKFLKNPSWNLIRNCELFKKFTRNYIQGIGLYAVCDGESRCRHVVPSSRV